MIRHGAQFFLVAAVLAGGVVPARAAGTLDPGIVKQYGGTYAGDCRGDASGRVRIASDTLVIDRGGKQVVSHDVQMSFGYFGQAAPPNYEGTVLGELPPSGQLLVHVYRDEKGLYLVYEPDAPQTSVLGKAAFPRALRSCDPPRPVEAAAPPSRRSGPPELYALDLLKDRTFKRLYRKALGPTEKEPWVVNLDGPGSLNREVEVQGARYVLTSVCKPHDCADNKMVVIYSAAKNAVYAKLTKGGAARVVGNPPVPAAAALAHLWDEQWRTP